MPKKFCFIRNFFSSIEVVYKVTRLYTGYHNNIWFFFVRKCTEMIWIFDCLEIKFSVGFDFTATIKLILIIASFYYMLLLAALIYSLIIDMARKFKL